jgi:hypothetical protein
VERKRISASLLAFKGSMERMGDHLTDMKVRYFVELSFDSNNDYEFVFCHPG